MVFGGFERREFAALAAACIVLLVVTGACVVRVIIAGTGLNYVSGTWAALAIDASHGTLYRPLIGPLGYGGTRYMPAAFLLHAAFIKVFNDAVLAGRLSTLLSAAFLLLGVYILVKRVSRDRIAAIFAAVLVLTSSAIQIELVSIRGDLLAAAFNVWALAFCARAFEDQARKRNVVIGGALFALAFLTKFTTVFGLAAGIASLGFAGKKREAGILAATATGLIAVGLLLIYIASQGRVWEVFHASATGGATWKNILLGPTMWFRVADSDDPWALAILALCAAVLVTKPPKHWLELVPLTLIVTTVMTVFMFGSPGVWANHLMDMNIIAIVFVVIEASRNEKRSTLLVGALAAITLCASAHIFFRVHSGTEYFSLTIPAPPPVKDDWSKAQRLIHGQGPLLSENPWFPILRGETPYALDSFSFRLASQRDPSLAADLSAKLASHYFRALVLIHDPENPNGHQFMDHWDFGPGFADHLLRYYSRAFTSKYFILYLPNRDAVTAGAQTTPISRREEEGRAAASLMTGEQ